MTEITSITALLILSMLSFGIICVLIILCIVFFGIICALIYNTKLYKESKYSRRLCEDQSNRPSRLSKVPPRPAPMKKGDIL